MSQMNIPCVKKIKQIFGDYYNQWLTIPQISRIAGTQHNTTQKAIHFIRKSGIEIEKSQRIYTHDDTYYHRYRMGAI